MFLADKLNTYGYDRKVDLYKNCKFHDHGSFGYVIKNTLFQSEPSSLFLLNKITKLIWNFEVLYLLKKKPREKDQDCRCSERDGSKWTRLMTEKCS